MALIAVCGCDVMFRVDRVPEIENPPIDLVAHYRFETAGPTIVDETGRHNGSVVGPGSLTTVPGPVGNGIEFPMGMRTYVVIPDSPDFDLVEGSIDLWMRTSSAAGDLGVFSRDSVGTPGGQILLVQRASMLLVRMQSGTDGGGGGGRVMCSDPVPLKTWIHVGINFGAPQAELWIDGVEQTSTQDIEYQGYTGPCGDAGARNLAGNNDPFVVGALGEQSTNGTADRVGTDFDDGAIDELRILGTRQDFAQR